MTREEFIEYIEKRGYIEDEYGYFIHPNFPKNHMLTVYSNYYTRNIRVEGTDDEVLEYSKHSFDDLDLIIFLGTDWNISYYMDAEYHLSCLLQLKTLFEDDFNNITEYNIAQFKRHQEKLKEHADYSERCIKEGAFNV